MLRSTIAVAVSVVLGGLIYLVCVSFMQVDFDAEQGADKAFSVGNGIDLAFAAKQVLWGTRSFFFWPENYFPGYLKNVQLIFIARGWLVLNSGDVLTTTEAD